MGRKIIRIGDRTTTGGVVIQGTPHADDKGRLIALLGHLVTCPVCQPHIGAIAEGERHWLVDGVPVALEGHIVACGCPWGANRLIANPDASEVSL